MFVPCPHCGFPIALIVAKDGAAHSCPRCDRALPSGGAAAAESLPDAPPAAEAAGAAEAGIATMTAIDSDDAAAAEPAAPDPVAALIAVDVATPPTLVAAEPAKPRPDTTHARRRGRKPGTPSFARTPHEAAIPLGPRWPGLLVIGALLLLLATQLLLVERATLAASPQWRPAIARVCAVLLCELPPWHEPQAIAMLDRGVQPHPRRAGVLSVRASFRNDARFPQPWPMLLLNLADVDGRPVAQGLLSPQDYGAPADGALLAPGQVASVGFAVREPEPRSVAFSFEFR